MRILFSTILIVLAANVGASADPWHHRDRFDPLNLVGTPPTDADLDRRDRAHHERTPLDDMIEHLGVRNGRAELFDDSDDSDWLSRSGVSGSVDGRGARLVVKW